MMRVTKIVLHQITLTHVFCKYFTCLQNTIQQKTRICLQINSVLITRDHAQNESLPAVKTARQTFIPFNFYAQDSLDKTGHYYVIKTNYHTFIP